MGSPLSSIVAEVVMGSLDQWINQTHSSDIHYWRRYVDDIFCILKPNKLQPILDTLHTFHADIKFTYETETNLLNTHYRIYSDRCPLVTELEERPRPVGPFHSPQVSRRGRPQPVVASEAGRLSLLDQTYEGTTQLFERLTRQLSLTMLEAVDGHEEATLGLFISEICLFYKSRVEKVCVYSQCLLSRSDQWAFNTFSLDTNTSGHAVPVLLLHLFSKYRLLGHFSLDVSKVWRCFNLVEAGYHSDNPYHNSVHAADVTQAMHCFLREKKIREVMSPLETMSALIASVCHDLDHPGVNQPFLIATSNHLASLYKMLLKTRKLLGAGEPPLEERHVLSERVGDVGPSGEGSMVSQPTTEEWGRGEISVPFTDVVWQGRGEISVPFTDVVWQGRGEISVPFTDVVWQGRGEISVPFTDVVWQGRGEISVPFTDVVWQGRGEISVPFTDVVWQGRGEISVPFTDVVWQGRGEISVPFTDVVWQGRGEISVPFTHVVWQGRGEISVPSLMWCSRDEVKYQVCSLMWCSRDEVKYQGRGEISVPSLMWCSRDEVKYQVRSLMDEVEWQVRSLILATDITRQQEFLSRFRRYLDTEVLNMEDLEYRHFILQIALKCADLCNPCRPWEISQRWSYQVCHEFYRQGPIGTIGHPKHLVNTRRSISPINDVQLPSRPKEEIHFSCIQQVNYGDLERRLNLPVTPMCDRHASSIPKIQVDFFKFVVAPLFEIWDRFLGSPLSSNLLGNLRQNHAVWESRVPPAPLPTPAAAEQETDEEELAEEEIAEDEEPSVGGRRHSMPLSLPRLLPRTTIRRQSLPHSTREKEALRHFHLRRSPHISLRTLSATDLMPRTSLLSFSRGASLLRRMEMGLEAERRLVYQPTSYPPYAMHALDPSVFAETSPQDEEKPKCINGCGTPSSEEDTPVPPATWCSKILSAAERAQPHSRDFDVRRDRKLGRRGSAPVVLRKLRPREEEPDNAPRRWSIPNEGGDTQGFDNFTQTTDIPRAENQLQKSISFKLCRINGQRQGQIKEAQTFTMELTPSQISKLIFRAPPFLPNDIPLWLNQLEAAFNFANFASDDDFKYNTIIVNLDRLALICVFDIVENPPVSGKYAALKERLLLRFGRSRQVRTAQVSETKPIADQRPSIILVELSKPPPSQHCDPCTPTSNSLQHLEQTDLPRDMNVTTTAPVTTVQNVEDTNSSSNFSSPSSSLSNSSSLDSSSFCSNPPSNTISCPPETVFSTPVHSDNPLPQQPPSHEEPLPQQPPSHEEPLPQQPPSHEESLLPTCEQKHPLFLEETNNAAATTPLHLQPAQTSVPQPLQPQNYLQQSSHPIEARVTTSLIPIAPPVLAATTPIAEQPIVSLQANKMVATHYIRTTFEKPPRPDPNPTRHPTKSSLYDYIGSLKILLEGE
ncbi:PDE7B [Cordylochernes scorpioides]|uniref:Phosphodiesterase n=1 Tax=Cordylochernes scorpioides TaxID=51811 RepID=A0ABY6KYU2_9ARAC|nr:PDE7B [Cordylochernes scorpioides]